MSDKVKIEMKVNGLALVFEPNITAYNKLINELALDSKVAPSAQYLRRIIHQDCKEALETVLKTPGAGIKLMGKVNEIYAPDLEIEVKN